MGTPIEPPHMRRKALWNATWAIFRDLKNSLSVVLHDLNAFCADCVA